jgi:hypothetical protein
MKDLETTTDPETLEFKGWLPLVSDNTDTPVLTLPLTHFVEEQDFTLYDSGYQTILDYSTTESFKMMAYQLRSAYAIQFRPKRQCKWTLFIQVLDSKTNTWVTEKPDGEYTHHRITVLPALENVQATEYENGRPGKIDEKQQQQQKEEQQTTFTATTGKCYYRDTRHNVHDEYSGQVLEVGDTIKWIWYVKQMYTKSECRLVLRFYTGAFEDSTTGTFRLWKRQEVHDYVFKRNFTIIRSTRKIIESRTPRNRITTGISSSSSPTSSSEEEEETTELQERKKNRKEKMAMMYDNFFYVDVDILKTIEEEDKLSPGYVIAKTNIGIKRTVDECYESVFDAVEWKRKKREIFDMPPVVELLPPINMNTTTTTTDTGSSQPKDRSTDYSFEAFAEKFSGLDVAQYISFGFNVTENEKRFLIYNGNPIVWSKMHDFARFKFLLKNYAYVCGNAYLKQHRVTVEEYREDVAKWLAPFFKKDANTATDEDMRLYPNFLNKYTLNESPEQLLLRARLQDLHTQTGTIRINRRLPQQ